MAHLMVPRPEIHQRQKTGPRSHLKRTLMVNRGHLEYGLGAAFAKVVLLPGVLS
jgi:hypothetical protein